MKKLFFFLVTAAALLTAASCAQKANTDNTPSVPAQIEANFTNLAKDNFVAGNPNHINLSASQDGAQLTLVFHTDKIYLPTGKFTLGEANGNYEGKFKNNVVDASIKSGEISVAMAGDGDYTLTGTLRLDNEAGTVLKLNASGNIVFDIPTEYYYTIEKDKTVGGAKANVFKIYDLQNHPIAEAAVVGAEEGEFTVADNTLVPAVADGGTWVYVENYGTEAYLHGKVTVSSSFGKKTFKFEDNHTVTLANCELKSSITPAYEDPGLFSWGFFTYNVVKSPVLKDMYEATVKLFYRLEGDVVGPEFLSTTIITSDDDLLMHNLGGGLPSFIVDYSDYIGYKAESFEMSSGRIAPQGASFFFDKGVKTTFGISMETGYFMVMNCQDMGGVYAIVCAPINQAYEGPANLLAVLKDANIYSAMGTLVELK